MCHSSGISQINTNMKKRAIISLTLLTLLFTVIVIAVTTVSQNCPIEGGYLEENEGNENNYYECLSEGGLPLGWHLKTENEKFTRIRPESSERLMLLWVELGMTIKGKEDLINSNGMFFQEFSNQYYK